MKCRECGAKIPDNKKFCIDCGAWVNPPEERQCIHNNYYEPERYNYNSSVLKNYEKRNSEQPSYKQTSGTKNSRPSINKGIIGLAAAVIIVFILVIVSSVLFNAVDELFSDNSYWDDYASIDSIIDSVTDNDVASVDYNDGYADEQEKLALEYVENYVIGMDYATFDKFTALDTEKVYRTIMNNHMQYHSFSTEEQFYNDISDTYNEPVSDIHGHISADLKSFANSELTDFAEMYNSDNISYAVTYSCAIDSEELYEYYYINLDSILEDGNSKLSDFLPDYNKLTDIYDICVDFIIDDGYNTYYESVWLVVADAGNGAEIVYDEILIDEMFNIINY